MGIISKTVEVKVHSNTVEYYKSLGYDIPMKKATKSSFEKYHKEFVYDFSKTIVIKIEDLQKSSNVKVEVLCDMCKNNKMLVKYQDYNKEVEKTGSYVCKECWHKKLSNTIKEKYNVESPLQSKLIMDKIRKTNLERYGTEIYAKTKECHEKIKQTCLERYGVEHTSRTKEVRSKTENTNIKKYGVKNVFESKEIQAKIRHSLYGNETAPISKQQLYIHSVYNGEINYPIQLFNVDICFPKEKIIIEYDGSGHNLNVKIGHITQEEFEQKEITRFNIIKREGYKQMRIISSKDLLPSDEILLQMLEIARKYFAYTSHTWINFDIDNSIMINAENKDTGGVFFDYGELRKIKEIA